MRFDIINLAKDMWYNKLWIFATSIRMMSIIGVYVYYTLIQIIYIFVVKFSILELII